MSSASRFGTAALARPLAGALLALVVATGAAWAHEDAPEVLERAARRGHWDAVALALARGQAALEDGDAAGARRHLAEAVAASPTDPRVAGFAARLALEDGRVREADSLASRSLAGSPNAVAVRLVRARARAAFGDAAGALADFDEAISASPGRAEEYVLERARAARALAGAASALAGLEAQTSTGAWTPARRSIAARLERELGRSPLERAGAAPAPVGPQPHEVRPEAPPAGVADVARTRGPYLQDATPTAISVRWRTASAVVGRVSIGPAGGPYTLTFDESGGAVEHEVRITGLSPETAYAYSVHGTLEAPEPVSDARTFRTPPPAGAPRPVRIWAIGDSGLDSPGGDQVRDAYLAWAGARREDLWLLLGDNAYYSGTDAEYQAGLFDQYPLPLSRSPLWSTRGNHDVVWAGVNNDYYDLFTLPVAGEAGGVPSGTEAWYAFDFGPVHFVCLDSEGSDRSVGGPMLQWLRADLAATTQPWVIGFWHHPPYTKGSHDSDDPADSGGRMRDMRANVLPILDSLGVDLVLSGHSHSYERSFLLDGHYGLSGSLTAAMKVDGGDGREGGDGAYHKSAGPTLAHEGAVYAVNGSACQVSGGTLDHPAMVASLNVLGSMVIDIAGERLDARFLDATGVVRDSFAIVKPVLVSVPGEKGPRAASFSAARPSPFRDHVELAFMLARPVPATLAVYDVSGRRVRTLAEGAHAAGTHRVTWDGRDDRGARVSAGAYLVLLDAGGERTARRVVRLP